MGATSAKHAPPFGARRAVPKGRPAAKRAASPRGVAQRRATRFQEVAVGVGFDSCTLSPLFSVPKLCVQPPKRPFMQNRNISTRICINRRQICRLWLRYRQRGTLCAHRLPSRCRMERLSLPAQTFEPFVDAAAAGKFLGLHPATVQRLARDSALPGHPVRGCARRRWRFLLSELSEWLKANQPTTRRSA